MTFKEVGKPLDLLVAVASWTILLSVLTHGISAKPLSFWYSRRLAKATEPLAELKELPELRERRRFLKGPSRG
jgi:NhaP-type Na+/H+ or K+/H+ antiporter